MNNKPTILRGALALTSVFFILTQIKTKKPRPVARRDEVKTSLSRANDEKIQVRDLAPIDNYGIWAKGMCEPAGSVGYYPMVQIAPGAITSKEACAGLCDPYDDCLGFSFSDSIKECIVHFDGYIDTQVNDGSTYPEINTPGNPAGMCYSNFVGSGPISKTGTFTSADAVCFERGSLTPGTLNAAAHYDSKGAGGCVDISGEAYDYIAIDLGSFGTPEICAEKCDLHSNNVGFEFDTNSNRCKCLFSDGETPVPLPAYLDPYEPIASAAAQIGTGEVQGNGNSVLDPFIICYKNSASTIVNNLAVNGDPLFMGFQGQVFKFDGRDGAWYANVASKNLQWNLRFGKFDSCPKKENMFVTGTAITIFRQETFDKNNIVHSIVVEVVDEDTLPIDCQSEVCLGNGTLKISIDGNDIMQPGDYPLANVGGRVVAYNTYAACSRKWYDYEKVSDTVDAIFSTARELGSEKVPVDYVIESRGEMVDAAQCEGWLNDRIVKNDLFDQGGYWSTVHIRTPLISFHVEYRQGGNGKDMSCDFNSLDAWITDASDKITGQEWKGVLGETRYPKFYADGKKITSDRDMLLVGKEDEDYEVDGPFGVGFKAREL